MAQSRFTIRKLISCSSEPLQITREYLTIGMTLRRNTRGSYVPLENNDDIVSRLAEQDKVPWHRKPNLRLLYLLMLPTCIGARVTEGYISTMVNGLQAVPAWLEYYDHPHSTSLGLMASMFSLGSIISVPFAPLIADKFGRRLPILVGGIGSMIGGILQGSALNFTMFVAARFILGFSSICCVVAASSLIGELSHPKERTVVGGVYGASYFFGAIIAAVVTFGTFSMTSNWAWRIPSFLQTVLSLFQVCFILFIPDSPRWLIFNGRHSEAVDILVKYHGEGDKDSEFVQAEYAQIKQTLEMGPTNWGTVLSTPGMQKRMIITVFLGLSVSWTGAGLISHFLSPILDSIGVRDHRIKNIVNLAYVLVKFVNSSAIALIIPRFHRRTMYLACTISLFVVMVTFTAASADYSLTHSKLSALEVLASIFSFTIAYSLAFSNLNFTYMVELFPFHVRASGVSMYEWWNRCGAFFSEFMNPIGIDSIGWRWYIIYCVWNAFQVLVVYVMFPETSGRTLEELTILFEEDREAIEDGAAELLCDHEETQTYGTMEERFGRNAGGEQGG